MGKYKIIEFPTNGDGPDGEDEVIIRIRKAGIGWNVKTFGSPEIQREEMAEIMENCAYQLRAQIGKD